MGNAYAHLGLRFNPFEPAASGTPLGDDWWVPQRWSGPILEFLNTMQYTSGPKAYAVLGEYGSGKTYLLRWVQRTLLKRRITAFFFDNPGVQFYDLANSLLRQVGRENFAKTLWEFLQPELPTFQFSLFGGSASFHAWLSNIARDRRGKEAMNALAQLIRARGVTRDEEIAYKLGRLIVETHEKPYFEYKDFVAGRKGSLVAEGEEAPYFAAILRALRLTGNAEGVAFLLDEFEEVSLQRRLTRRQAQDYLATMKRLIGLTEREQFWIIVAMTPQAAEMTKTLEPALWERFVSEGKYEFIIPPLNDDEATELVRFRLNTARVLERQRSDLFPFPDDLVKVLREDIKSTPRKLVKTCSVAIARAAEDGEKVELPFSAHFMRRVQEEVYPATRRGAEEV